ncbi:MAG: hypothetical protein AB1486_20880 [Planctomycetota bacterium]
MCIPELVTSVLLALGSSGAPQEESAPIPWSKAQQKEISTRQLQIKPSAGYFKFDTPYWYVKTDVSGHFTAEISLLADLLATAFHDILRTKPTKSVVPSLWVFSNESDLRKYVPDATPMQFRPKYDNRNRWIEFHVYVLMPKGATELASLDLFLLRSTCLDALITQVAGRADAPQWLFAACRAYLGTWDFGTNRAENQAGWPDRARFRSLIERLARMKDEELPRISDLLVMTRAQWNARPDAERMDLDAQAESLLHLLTATKEGRPYLEEIIDAASKGRPLDLTEREKEALDALFRKCLREWIPPLAPKSDKKPGLFPNGKNDKKDKLDASAAFMIASLVDSR